MKHKIVLAEDEPHIAKLAQFKLEHDGYEVIWAPDGGAAFDSVKTHHPDIVLLDVMMPVMDGYQVLKKLKEDEELKNIPVIMLTAKGQERDVAIGKNLGAVDYIIKPFRPGDLVERVKNIIGG
jgi:DNA-binding response OmpR family regulator